ncbi:PH domain-containing protein [Nocardioides sp.]|uniref:PH domain-containing protein n=1 Tax=Nocardioides sp. TaxID=35761 RepID=UPI003D135004
MAISRSLLNDGEHVVVGTRTHPKVLALPVLLLVVLLAAGVVVGNLIGDAGQNVPRLAIWAVVLIAILWFVVRPVITWYTTTYTFTNRRLITRSGLIAKEGRTIPLNRISGVDFEMGVVDRMFGCGTLVVSDASTDGRVELHDIPHVEQVQLQVAEELNRLSGERHHDGS